MKSKIILASLFKKGSLFVFKPLLVKYIIEEADSLSIQAAFSVPKKRFKLAVDRNNLKRKIREAHRLHLPEIKAYFENRNLKISIIYIYTSNQKFDYHQIEKSLMAFIKELKSKFKTEETNL